MKETKKQRRERKEKFMNETVPKLKLDGWIIQEYPHFIKIEVGYKEFDYYPGAQKIKHCTGEYAAKKDWQELPVDTFIKSLRKRVRPDGFLMD